MEKEQKTATQTEEISISVGGKAAYGVGAVGEAVFLALFTGFITIYYNQVLGLRNDLIGTAIMLALIGDAISDPIVGIISDRWRSRFGRRHPFLLAAPLPLVVSILCIFSPPESLVGGEGGPAEMPLFLWLTFWTILGRGFQTLYHVPHLALGGEMARDQHQRSQLFSANTIFNYGTWSIFVFVAYRVFFAGEREKSVDGETVMVPAHLDGAAYVPLIYTSCLIIMLAIFSSAFGTWKYIPNLSPPPAEKKKLSPVSFLIDVGSTLKNRNYLILVAGFFFFMLTSGIYDTTEVFMFTYFWELPTEKMAWLRLVGAPSAVTGALLAPILMKKFDRKPVMLVTLAGSVIFAQLPVDLRLLGLFFDNDHSALLPTLLVNRAGFAFSLGVNTVVVLSMISDIIDSNELETGDREEGLYYSARAFFAKASSSFGIFFAGLVLEHYIHMPNDAVPGELDSGVVFRMGIVAGPIMACAAVVALFCYNKYDLTRERHQEIVDALQKRAASGDQHE